MYLHNQRITHPNREIITEPPELTTVFDSLSICHHRILIHRFRGQERITAQRPSWITVRVFGPSSAEQLNLTKIKTSPKDALLDKVLDSGYLPHAVIRTGIRRQLQQRLSEIQSSSLGDALTRKMDYIAASRSRPIAVETATANKQHYEVATGVYAATLGPRMKYSACLYPKGSETLAQAEVEMLRLYLERGELKDGMKILDLG